MGAMSDDLLRIGPFSRASWLSIKTLRAYHEAGLLVPAVVDPTSGYRSYTAAQLTDAVIIRRLRELDVPLAAVRQVLDAGFDIALHSHGTLAESEAAAKAASPLTAAAQKRIDAGKARLGTLKVDVRAAHAEVEDMFNSALVA